jgi:transposase InsO family protein
LIKVINILTVIDLFSKYAFCIPLKNKTSQSIIDAFEYIFKTSNRKPKKLWSDLGSEFTNKLFKNFCNKEGIEIYHTFNEGKAVIIERFNRTLKEKMYFNFTLSGNKHWVDLLPKVVNDYNNSFHRTIKMTPEFASKNENEHKVR